MKRNSALRLSAAVLRILLVIGLVASFQPVFASPAANQSGPQTYTVLTGAEDAKNGVDLNLFFPNKLTIHPGDTVRWIANSTEIHTVTFLAGKPMPELISMVDPALNAPSPLEINPIAAVPAAPAGGMYNGSTFANSGLIGSVPGLAPAFDLTFTKAGVYTYLCLVHGMMMSGEIDVVPSTTPVLAPKTVAERARSQISDMFRLAPQAYQIANLQTVPDEHNPDGSTTHHVMLGAMVGPFDLMRFFPSRVYAKPGDTIVWQLGSFDVAPHTVTFLNGSEEPEVLLPFPAGANPPQHLLFNPRVLFPANAQGSLNDKAYINSGLLDTTQGPHTFSIKVDTAFTGTLPYICVLHDAAGMEGSIIVRK